MMENYLKIDIKINEGEVVTIQIIGESVNQSIFKIDDNEATQNGESAVQILEGHSYEYSIDNGYYLEEVKGITSLSKLGKQHGRITPGIYVGTLNIGIFNVEQNQKKAELKVEVRSVKATYRQDYRVMLEEITERCTDLLLQSTSPASQLFNTAFDADSRTLYQRFAFMKAVLESDEFNDAVHKFIVSPVTKWTDSETTKDIRSLRKIENKALRQIATLGNRVIIPEGHSRKQQLNSLPRQIIATTKEESLDTAENRFIKYALATFLAFCTEIRSLSTYNRLCKEASLLEERLERYLNYSIFKDISEPVLFPLNSPILQRKEGYREILKVWLMFDLAAKLIWHGGEDVYSGNKRDVATLYEYWVFFKLLNLIEEVFDISGKSIDNLIEETKDGLGLKLKQGRFLPIKGIYNSGNRPLNVEFSYNKTFNGNSKYPARGSWSRSLRPDYTLSIWPYGIDSMIAEEEELIVHIHFDAKYKIESLVDLFGDNEGLDKEKVDQERGIYKRADLLKMHTYRDAIRRTAGAYILYPGSTSTKIHGFHELLPGLGAFTIKPSKSDDGIKELKDFLSEVIHHFQDRASQRERMSFMTFEVYKEIKKDVLKEPLPETYGKNRGLLPDETYILVAYYKQENWNWILKSGLYNARAGNLRGSLRLGPRETGARFLLLHSDNESQTSKLLRISEIGPRVFSKETLIRKGYPSTPSQEFYLVYKVEEVKEWELKGRKWDITRLEGYKAGRGSALPFAITMTELMKTLVK